MVTLLNSDLLLFRKAVDIPGPGEAWEGEGIPHASVPWEEELSTLDERRIISIASVLFPRGKAGQYEAILQVSYLTEASFGEMVALAMEHADDHLDGGEVF